MSELEPRLYRGAPLCPKCSSENVKVIDVRQMKEGGWRRRRLCKDCEHRWTSYSGQYADENRISLIQASERLLKRMRALEGEVVDLVDVLRRKTNYY